MARIPFLDFEGNKTPERALQCLYRFSTIVGGLEYYLGNPSHLRRFLSDKEVTQSLSILVQGIRNGKMIELAETYIKQEVEKHGEVPIVNKDSIYRQEATYVVNFAKQALVRIEIYLAGK